jgi:pimeloyl-ACP methyl ester carboxylesterase
VAEQLARVGEVELCYETFGDRADPAMLLVMGLGTQMLGWHEELCEQLAGRGFHVIRFDNRDIGRSSRVSHVRPPTLLELLRHDRRTAGYSLSDMADDAVGLLDHLGIERAHVVGASMGGMIAQIVAIRHPERVLSLVSIMANTGGRWSGQPALAVLPTFLRAAPRDREGYADHMVKLYGAIGSRGLTVDRDDIRRAALAAYDRGVDRAGPARQLAAIVAERDRTPQLRRLRVPTLVIHGTADRLVRPSGGRHTARAIPGARLLTIEGMGHDLPRGAWPRIVDAIEDNAARYSTASSTTMTASTNRTAPATAGCHWRRQKPGSARSRV